MQPDTRALIQKELVRVSRHLGVTPLLAVEAGSRARGYSAPQSDYDIRFIYKRPIKEYFKLKNPSVLKEWQDTCIKGTCDTVYYTRKIDTTEGGVTLDVVGWNISKVCRLMAECNGSLYEWSGSPIIYDQVFDFSVYLNRYLKDYLNPHRLTYHYYGLAKSSMEGFMDAPEGPLKSYLFFIRCVLAANYVAKHKRSPWVSLVDLLDSSALPENLENIINDLIVSRAQGVETLDISNHFKLNAFLTESLRSLKDLLESEELLKDFKCPSIRLAEDFYFDVITSY